MDHSHLVLKARDYRKYSQQLKKLADNFPDNMTLVQYDVLDAISELNSASQTALVRKTGIDRSTISDVVTRLIGKGLIARKVNENDRRAYTVTLTADGKKVLKQLYKIELKITKHK